MGVKRDKRRPTQESVGCILEYKYCCKTTAECMRCGWNVSEIGRRFREAEFRKTEDGVETLIVSRAPKVSV